MIERRLRAYPQVLHAITRFLRARDRVATPSLTQARCLMADVNKVHSVRTIGLVAQELDKTEDEITVLALGMDMEDGLI